MPCGDILFVRIPTDLRRLPTMKILQLLFCICIHQAIGSPAGAVASVNITFVLSAESLPCQDVGLFSKPDAFVAIFSFLKSPGLSQKEPQPFGTTSTIRDDSNPEWPDKFSYNWKNGTGQTWLFWVFDHDHVTSNDPIGAAEVSVDRFMESGGSLRLKLYEEAGSIVITRYPYRRTRTVPIAFKLSAKNLPPRDRIWGYMGASDPYAVISYQNGKNGRVNALHKTGIFTNKANPSWPRPIEFTQYEPKTNQTLHFHLYDRDLLSKDEFLGDVSIPADYLYERSGSVVVPLRNSEGNAAIVLEMYSRPDPEPRHTTESVLFVTSAEPMLTTTTATVASSDVPLTPATTTVPSTLPTISSEVEDLYYDYDNDVEA
ncbi:unnamed protein product [Allacma fusca]|uniref:C2 domain-containing protein n=1 Tax=Allacma fusca TaxID=39272 RepID=A0A8J2PJK5_9HEXA|nr:unnamed protein product [Allacma fusca]